MGVELWEGMGREVIFDAGWPGVISRMLCKELEIRFFTRAEEHEVTCRVNLLDLPPSILDLSHQIKDRSEFPFYHSSN